MSTLDRVSPDPIEWSLCCRRAPTALATCEAAGIIDEVFAALRFSIVESNGCVSILESGRLLCSLPADAWKQRLDAALKKETP